MSRYLVLLIFVLLSIPSYVFAQQSSTLPANGKAKQTQVRQNKESENKKISTSGFSFLLEPVPHWVQPQSAPEQANLSKSAAVNILLSDEQINLDLTKRSNFIHLIKQVSASAGLSNAAQIQMEFDPSYQELVIHKIELLRGGQRIDKLDSKRVQLLQRETQLEARMYDGRVTASIVLDDVRVGDCIEYSYSIRGSNPVFESKFSFMDMVASETGPIAQYRLRVIYPAAKKINYRIPKGIEVENLERANQRELVFQQSSIAQTTHEQSTSPSFFIDQFIQLSEFSDWNEVASWGQRLFEVAYLPNDKLNDQVEKWRTLPAKLDQLTAVLDFVQKEVRYFGTEIGVNSHRPENPSKILTQRYGDCKDKTTLLIAMLKALNIPAKPVLASASFREGINKFLPTPQAFDHVIALVELDGVKYWLDATRDHQTGNAEKRQVRDYGNVLVASADSSDLILLQNSMKELVQIVEDKFQLTKMSSYPVLVSTTTYYGVMAEQIRDYLAHATTLEVQAQYVKPYLHPYPKIRPNGSLQVVEVANENAIQLVQEFEMKEFWSIDKFEKLKSALSFWSLEEKLVLPADVTRKTPFQISRAGMYRHSIISEFSEDLLDSYKEEKFVDGQTNFSISGSLQATARKAVWVCDLQFLSREVTPAQWRSFSDKAKQVRKHFHYQLVAHALDKAQIDALQKDLIDISSKRSGIYIPQHQRAKVILLFANAMLESTRLSPEVRKLVFLMRAHAFQVLNMYERSALDINSALDLSPEPDPDTLGMASVVAFSMRNGALANEFLQQGLDLSPHEKNLNELKAIYDYFNGNYQAAVERTTAQLSTREESIDYLGLIRYLSQRKIGNLSKDELKQQLDDNFSSPDINGLLKYYLGSVDLNTVLKRYDNSNIVLSRLCQVYFYAGELMSIEGKLAQAKEYWSKAVDSAASEQIEFMMAKARLDEYAKNTPKS